MTVEKLIKLLQKMPKGCKVRFKDLGSDQDQWEEVNYVLYVKGEGVKLDHKPPPEPSEYEYLLPE